MNKTDYKKIYSENMNGLKWNTKLFVIHHIDLNHNNNDFNNLVLIPAKLHQKFHTALIQFNNVKDMVDITSPKPEYHNVLCMYDFYFSEFLKLKFELSYFWTMKQEYLRGSFPIFFDSRNKNFEDYLKCFDYSKFNEYCLQGECDEHRK